MGGPVHAVASERPVDREAGSGPRRTSWPDLHDHQVRRGGHRLGRRTPAPSGVGRLAGRRRAWVPQPAARLRRSVGHDCGAPTSWSPATRGCSARCGRRSSRLLASVRSDTPWAPSPGGLSSDGYNGHVFWDSETWMYPSLLATEPALARASLQYRFDRLRAARANATKTGWKRSPVPVGERAARQRGDSGVRQDRASSRSTSMPTSRSPCTSTGWRPATGTGWRPGAGRCSRASPTTTQPGDANGGRLLQHPQHDPA